MKEYFTLGSQQVWHQLATRLPRQRLKMKPSVGTYLTIYDAGMTTVLLKLLQCAHPTWI